MRIIPFEQFIEEPVDTLFCEVDGCVFGELCIKNKSIEDFDFFYTPLFGVKAISSIEECRLIDRANRSGEDIEIDCDAGTRDGIFDDSRMFAVFSFEDVERIICKLRGCSIGAMPVQNIAGISSRPEGSVLVVGKAIDERPNVDIAKLILNAPKVEDLPFMGKETKCGEIPKSIRGKNKRRRKS